MNTNPSAYVDFNFYVLVNEEEQHSFWPSFAEIPAGWQAVFGQDSYEACINYVAQNWADMRSKDPADTMGPSRSLESGV
ncbi:MbtH family NRPS accessory protein [Nocardia terpenica]|uniref:MbtH family protein n=1 Tax=Nocardia terpenica TaxID=455432 RepID=UPI002FE0DFDC